jgi:GNAT superfamily N-acetyltransferase
MTDVSLKIASINDNINIPALVHMINEVYRSAEDYIWKPEHQRTSFERLNGVIASNELLIAYVNEEIAGCIHLEKINKQLYKFKMLAVPDLYKGNKLGSKLVAFAESTALSYGANTMQLELLTPVGFTHQNKLFLHNWYTKIGYLQKSIHSVDYCHPGISEFLKIDCNAVVYQKPLI